MYENYEIPGKILNILQNIGAISFRQYRSNRCALPTAALLLASKRFIGRGSSGYEKLF
jgi:hypothetical protein